jgi:hypothetical protein
MLRSVENHLLTITEYKKGNENYTRSMYEDALDNTDVQLIERLLSWLQKRYGDMMAMVSSNSKVDELSPIHDYVGMFTFNQPAFLAECGMYQKAIQGCQVVVQYKLENTGYTIDQQIITTNEPPTGA